jgi:hypothetical protein
MIINFDAPSMGDDIMTFADWTYPVEPLQGPVIETIYIRGSTSTGNTVTGTTDQKEGNP